MRWFRVLLVVALVSLFGACSSHNGPEYPTEEDVGKEDVGKKKGGFVVTMQTGIWV